ncbi:hypothetical protein QUB30_04450 [Microcoleus sp. BROC3]
MKRTTSVAAGKATASTKLIAAHLSKRSLSYVQCRRSAASETAWRGLRGAGRRLLLAVDFSLRTYAQLFRNRVFLRKEGL